jgi:hypothetical protein
VQAKVINNISKKSPQSLESWKVFFICFFIGIHKVNENIKFCFCFSFLAGQYLFCEWEWKSRIFGGLHFIPSHPIDDKYKIKRRRKKGFLIKFQVAIVINFKCCQSLLEHLVSRFWWNSILNVQYSTTTWQHSRVSICMLSIILSGRSQRKKKELRSLSIHWIKP